RYYDEDHASGRAGCIELFNTEVDRDITLLIEVDSGYTAEYTIKISPAIQSNFNYTQPSTPNPMIKDDVYENYEISADGSIASGNTIDLTSKLQLTEKDASLATGQIKNITIVCDDKNYIVSNGYYELTQDESLVDGKKYYNLENGEYVKIDDPTNANIGTYYEFNPDCVLNRLSSSYQLTQDTEINAEKTYYTKQANMYIEVIEPIFDDLATYYELVHEEKEYLRVKNDNGNWSMEVSQNLKELISTLSIKLEITVKVQSKVDGLTTKSYNAPYYYKINFNPTSN
ncbi:MAG: hypothetical protein IJX26_01535, partial [Clostridia bacterium]|nr:hypothetical protein [Clostridia bacterium]